MFPKSPVPMLKAYENKRQIDVDKKFGLDGVKFPKS